MMRMAHPDSARQSSAPASGSRVTARVDIRGKSFRNCKNSTTENRGGPRSFLGYRRDLSNRGSESMSAFLIFDSAAALFVRGSMARAADGPVTRCSSVVLSALRGKAWRSRFSTLTHATGALRSREPLAANGAFP